MLDPAPCFLEDCDAFADHPNVEFGYLVVPEDYGRPEGESIRVAYSRIRSTAPDPKPDPILVLAGGWGLPEVFQTLGYLRNMPVRDRDIIMYDYRGTGFSHPGICPELGKRHWSLVKEDLDYASFAGRLKEQFDDCLTELERRGIDYRHYGTATKTRDAVHLVEQLGYGEVNLLGVSNGTVGIQGFLRAAEDSEITVRSIYSDSNVPLVDYTSSDATPQYKYVLDKLLDDCAADPACNAAYPDLRRRFYTYLKSTLTDPPVYYGKDTVVLNTYLINSTVHQLLYTATNYKDIPLVLEGFIAGELHFMGALLDRFEPLLDRTNGTSLINFAYDWKHRQAAARAQYDSVRREIPEFMIADFWIDFFVHDTTLTYDPRDTVAVYSDRPALVVAGEYDPITAVGYSETMHERYRGSYYYELPHTAHGVLFTPCGARLYREFTENPEVRPSDSCVVALERAGIDFTTGLYRNERVSELANTVGRGQPLWTAALALPLLFSLVVLLVLLMRGVRGRGFDTLAFVLALLTLLFLAGLVGYSLRTLAEGGLTVLFGLVGAAGWLPWCVVAIVLAGVALMYRTARATKTGGWRIGLIVSTILVVAVALRFGIHPF